MAVQGHGNPGRREDDDQVRANQSDASSPGHLRDGVQDQEEGVDQADHLPLLPQVMTIVMEGEDVPEVIVVPAEARVDLISS